MSGVNMMGTGSWACDLVESGNAQQRQMCWK